MQNDLVFHLIYPVMNSLVVSLSGLLLLPASYPDMNAECYSSRVHNVINHLLTMEHDLVIIMTRRWHRTSAFVNAVGRAELGAALG